MGKISDISDLNLEDTYSIALLLLYVFKGTPRYSTLSELAYVLDHQNFINFLKYFEGQTITIPSTEEVTKSLKLLLLYQYNVVEGVDWRDALKKAGFEQSETHTARGLLTKFKQVYEEYNL